MTGICCGIDFGTSNSTCALATAQGTALVALEGDSVTLPSTVFFGRGTPPLFGRAAVNAYISGEDGRLMKALKSVLGTALMEEKTTINLRPTSFVDILSLYFRHLKDAIDQKAGADTENVVLGRPVHFHDDNEDADGKSEDALAAIARAVGFRNIVFQYEPIAAAFSHEMNVQDEKLSLVIDLGGGTSDFTVIRLSPDRKNRPDRQQDILATTGIRVGGTTFDRCLSLAAFMPLLGLHSEYADPFDGERRLTVPSGPYHDLSDWPRVSFAQTRRAVRDTQDILKTAIAPGRIRNLLEVQERQLGHALLQAVENAKIGLTDREGIVARFTELEQPLETGIGRAEFEDSISVPIARINASIDDCLRQAGIRPGDVELVILTGGSTELPLINERIRQTFPNAAISNDNKFGSVGLGLAYFARHCAFPP